MSVGDGSSGAGGELSLVGGESTDISGGRVFISSGVGSGSSGDLVLTTAKCARPCGCYLTLL